MVKINGSEIEDYEYNYEGPICIPHTLHRKATAKFNGRSIPDVISWEIDIPAQIPKLRFPETKFPERFYRYSVSVVCMCSDGMDKFVGCSKALKIATGKHEVFIGPAKLTSINKEDDGSQMTLWFTLSAKAKQIRIDPQKR